MSYTIEDFRRDYTKEHFVELPANDQVEVLQKLSPETRLAGLTEEQIRQYLEQISRRAPKQRRRKPGRKKK